MALSEPILKKIKKLLALANDPSNEHEAAAAAAKVQELLFAHNSSMEQVKNYRCDDHERPRASTVQFSSLHEKTWKVALYDVVAKHNFCYFIDIRGSRYANVVGTKANLAVVDYLFTYLRKTIARLAWAAAKREKGNYNGCGSAFRRGFHFGAIDAIDDRLAAQHQQNQRSTSQAGNMLVRVLDRELMKVVDETFPNRSQYEVKTGDALGRAMGHQAGEKIPINKGVATREAAVQLT